MDVIVCDKWAWWNCTRNPQGIIIYQWHLQGTYKQLQNLIFEQKGKKKNYLKTGIKNWEVKRTEQNIEWEEGNLTRISIQR